MTSPHDVRIGLFMGVTDQTVDVRTLATTAEALGFESVFVPEHTHIPTSRRTPWGGGDELPMAHKRGLDPFVALSAAASVTTSLRVGTGVCLVPARDPILLAKEVATLDWISGGRVLFGVGAGWNREEIADHGVDPAARFAVMDDRMMAVRAMWASDEAEYHGPYVDFGPTWQWPKPVQVPNPPILVGGHSVGALERVVAYGDGWMPFVGHGSPDLAELAERLAAMLDAAERDPVPVTVFGVPVDAEIEPYLVAGVARIVFRLPPSTTTETIAMLARLADRLRPSEVGVG